MRVLGGLKVRAMEGLRRISVGSKGVPSSISGTSYWLQKRRFSAILGVLGKFRGLR